MRGFISGAERGGGGEEGKQRKECERATGKEKMMKGGKRERESVLLLPV